uniref:SCP domain-containing protein n=1 Tax=Panagrellus redivivus TaxID=6233 RepID=A0A7E4VQQ8_PANRE
MMSPDVTEFGCFIKVCGKYEYMACKTGHVVSAPREKPLYTPGKRCMADEDCTLPGYTRCDTVLGLCDFDPPDKKIETPLKQPFVCLSVTSSRMPLIKEKCDDVHDTGSEISIAERKSIVESINKLRAMINNNCTLGLGIPKPASNYRKVKYSCELESKSKFECSQTNPFNNDKETWRHWIIKKSLRRALFHLGAPIAREFLINPETATVDNDPGKAVFMKLFMSEDVTGVGCYVKVCGNYECIACKTNHNSTLPYDSPLYTPGQRCNVDADCTLPGYHTCDVSVGLCDFKNHLEIKAEARSRKCADVRSVHIQQKTEQCSLGYNTGSEISNTERELIVYTVNYFRKRINNNCDFGQGIVKHITNYRKVKYSCAFEEDVKFECANVDSDNFKSDNYTLREIRSKPGFYRIAIFESFSPWKEFMLIDPDDQTIGAEGLRRIYAQIMLSPDVTEIGCFVKVCDGSEYLACKTDQPIITPENEPLYKPGNRCLANEDCTLPGYRICDIESGLCESY